MFGGFTTGDMKRKLGVPSSRALADFLPTVTIKAKDLAAEMTNYTVKTSDLRSETRISTHARQCRVSLFDELGCFLSLLVAFHHCGVVWCYERI